MWAVGTVAMVAVGVFSRWDPSFSLLSGVLGAALATYWQEPTAKRILAACGDDVDDPSRRV